MIIESPTNHPPEFPNSPRLKHVTSAFVPLITKTEFVISRGIQIPPQPLTFSATLVLGTQLTVTSSAWIVRCQELVEQYAPTNRHVVVRLDPRRSTLLFMSNSFGNEPIVGI
ncbi:hypothetical protein AG0111_0g229 [Alternaria gaisen]|uniref:Uncharacterized protein n=1 Tax=Alternaria gaisen TaxID=167740 RepID=A0ACB6G2F9_9PLEO|nr:hypothetical protein AG0111_0g229 [Alternaria gaisen]